MKTIFLLAASILFIGQSQAQSTDPTYSVHNYKHPDKAKVAKEKDLDKQLHLVYAEPTAGSTANYKMPNNSKSAKHGALIPAQPAEKNVNSVFNDRNYKRQN